MAVQRFTHSPGAIFRKDADPAPVGKNQQSVNQGDDNDNKAGDPKVLQ